MSFDSSRASPAGCCRSSFLRRNAVRRDRVELPQYFLDALLDYGVVRAVARDIFLDDCSQCLRRKVRVGNSHENITLPPKAATLP